jgi:toxin YoeB
MRGVAFLPKAFEDFYWWATQDRRILARITELVRDIDRQPFSGLGKPEPLKHELRGLWSRRITDEHRLVYKVTDNEIVVVSCRFHYD